ncbi:hypothetical protein AU210_010162 [Fusarium oxysporum f. sp. radicis-cucumerinum]|uniref:Uncharacterized protein n=1 Tax=Fusarium oxysporum f. sp. radicis-cucumerinum TaxID=327505 RepID=A0A2H3GIC2_FUSOX|nr:hypothetical protein AU210_010162 [Fusarium oxysporum f. sp. radicis-cucumerinum]
MEANRINAEMLFVVSDMERDLGIGVKDDGNVTPVTLTFSELFDALRVSKKGATNGQWITGPQSSWRKGQALPLRVVLVICLDPHMSADCALCLLGTVKWAVEQVSNWDQTDIVVLTVSAEKEFNFLSKVVSFSAPNMQVPSVDLAAHGVQDPTLGIQARTDCRRLILSFDEKLGDQFQQQLREAEKTTVEFRSVQATVNVGPLLHLERSKQGPKTLFITFQGEVPFLPLEIHNFDELHLVMGTSGIYQKAWDDISRQVIELPHWASMEDRHLQSWWIRQPSIPSRTLYTGTGIDPDAALSCFVRQAQRAQEMSLRLHIQRLTAKDGLDLSEKEAGIFRTVVSLLGYDHRLALFVALDSGPEARRVKVQLTIMLKHGMDRTIRIHSSVFNDRKRYNSVLRGCYGLGSSMARQGTMWLNLGLLKRHQQMAEQHHGDAAQQDPLSELVRVRPDRALLIGSEIGEILDHLVNIDVNVDSTRSVAQETKELGSEAKGEISYHLVRAFTHNLIVTENFSKNENDTPRLSHRVMATWLELTQGGRAKLIDINSYLKKEGACAFGICYDLA